MSNIAENEFFSDGVTEDILMYLSRVKSLHVISRTSIMRFKDTGKSINEIAADLKVGSILVGSVRHGQDRVRVSAQLIDALEDRQLWAGSFDRELTDIFEVQTQVAIAITNALKAELTQNERRSLEKIPTHNMDAYGLWLRGRSTFAQLDELSLIKSVDLFTRASRLDPEYANAQVGLAEAHLYLCLLGFENYSQSRKLALSAAQKAVDLDPTLPEAQAIFATVQCWLDWNWEEAEVGFHRALNLSGSSVSARTGYAYLLTIQGKPNEAMAQIRRARDFDPLSLEVMRLKGFYAYQNRRFDKALSVLSKVLELEPAFLPALLTLVGYKNAKYGDRCLSFGSSGEVWKARSRKSNYESDGDRLW